MIEMRQRQRKIIQITLSPYKLAKKGETVLLSPCCASFDLFNSYEDRGDQFKKYVEEDNPDYLVAFEYVL